MGGHSARRAWRTLAWMLIALFVGATGLAAAQPDAGNETTLEHRVKAAFLYKIAGYVEWPGNVFPKNDTPLTIGVMGAELLATELTRAVKGRSAHNRPITVKSLKPRDSLDGMHVLFVGREQQNHIKDLVPGALRRSMLVVTEWEGALTQGSMVNFIIVDGRVRFEVSIDAARAAELKFSSRLLAVAQHVESGTP